MKKFLLIVGVVFLVGIVVSHWAELRLASMPHGDLAIPGNQANVFRRAYWARYSPAEMSLDYYLRAPSADLQLVPANVQTALTESVCRGSGMAAHVDVIVYEPDNAKYLTFAVDRRTCPEQ